MPTALVARVLALTAMGWAVAACTDTATPLGDRPPADARPTQTAGDQSLGDPGGPVADVRAEATAVAHHLAEGNLDVATVRASYTGRVAALDFDGTPSFYLVFTSLDPNIVEPLTFASRQGPALLQTAAATSTVVGASEERPEVAVAESGLSLLFDIGETIVALGGLPALDHIVAPLPGVLLLVDHDGVYWDVKTRVSLSAETLEARKKQLADVDAAERDAAAAIAQDEWSLRRTGAGTSSAPDVDFASVKTPRGNLDLARAVDATLASVDPAALRLVARSAVQEEIEATSSDHQGLWNNTTENCFSWWFFGWHSSCDHVEVGEITDPAKNQAHMPWQGRGHTMPKCISLSGATDTNAYLGCGPAAFTTLVWADWKAGGTYTSLAALDRSAISPYLAIDANYKAFSNTIAEGVIDAMSTCSFGDDGALTTPGGFKSGANAWLTTNGSTKQVRMQGGVLGLGAGLDDYATTLHERIGLRGQPTAAGFDLGFVSSHWSPVYKYRIVRPAGLGRLQVYIQSLDWKDRWYSLGGIKLLSALAWLE